MRAVIFALAVCALQLLTPADAQQLVCAADLNGDGAADTPAEQASCEVSGNGALCPIEAVACDVAVDGATTCPLNPVLACVDTGTGTPRCSAHACTARSSIPAEQFDPPSALPRDDGPTDANGNCLGEVRIFPGMASRCRRVGVQTTFSNCCRNDGGAIQDSMGNVGTTMQQIRVISTVVRAAGAAISGGIGAANDILAGSFDPTTLALNVAIALIADFLLQGCDERDMTTALLKDSGYCVLVGTYCAESWPLVGCVQQAESHCCYNSKLARIIQEQGRQQLPSVGGFGTPRAPNCRGFSAEEFQALDFSKVDLSEYYAELRTKSQGLIEGEIRTQVEARHGP